MATKNTKKILKKAFREPTDRQKRLLAAFGGIGMHAKLRELGDTAYKRERPAAKRFSWARNNIRWLLKNKFVARVGKKGDGKYKRVAKS